MTKNENDLFQAFRQKVFGYIEKQLQVDGHHKSYEGAIDLSYCYPNYFEQDRGVMVVIELHCYLIGPTRHYKWYGDSVVKCLLEANKDLDGWIREGAENAK